MTGRFSVPEAAVQAHCRRVATWSRELAGALGLSRTDQDLLGQAALLHHVPALILDDGARSQLLADMKLNETGEQAFVPDAILNILQTFWGRETAVDPAIAKVVAALEISDDFDQFFESEPLLEDDRVDSSVGTMMSYLQVTSRADVSRVIDRLPVFPRAAREVICYATDPEVTIERLGSVIKLDPVLSGLLIQTANSAFYSPQTPIGSISRAIGFIGTEITRKILLAAAFRGSFASMRLHQLWNHSLDVAHAAERMARHAGASIDPGEAFLAGLVHDVGRLAFSLMPTAFLDRFDRLTSGGCPPVEVEVCLAGLCHGEIGAETLTQWKFPEPIVQAVRWHHRPERTEVSLASLLYLAEYWSDSEEDLPSYVRLNTACRQTGIDLANLSQASEPDAGYLASLRFAA